MKSLEYSKRIFVNWIIISILHALIIYLFIFYALESLTVTMNNGQLFGFWVGGTAAYGGCVLIVNMLVLIKFNIHDGYNLLGIAVMILAYFVILAAQSATGKFQDIEYIFSTMFGQPLVWLCFILACGIIFVEEYLYKVFFAIRRNDYKSCGFE
jgi:hypothetical protein